MSGASPAGCALKNAPNRRSSLRTTWRESDMTVAKTPANALWFVRQNA